MKLVLRLGKIPVEIHPSFFFLALLLGASGGGLAMLLSWCAVVFVSVLLHELGHASVGMAFGLAPRIDLHAMGGTTSWTAGAALATWQRVAISLAGPLAGLIVGGATYALARAGALPPGDLVGTVVGQILWVNVGWGVLNLLPMLPLDGGNVMLHTLHALLNGRGERPARVVSIVVAGLAAIASMIVLQNWWAAVLSLTFAGANVQALKALGAAGRG